MKTVKVRLVNVINNSEFNEKVKLYNILKDACTCIINELFEYIHGDDRFHQTLFVLFSKKEVKQVYSMRDVYNINPNIFIKFTKEYIDPLIEKLIFNLEKLKLYVNEYDVSSLDTTKEGYLYMFDLCNSNEKDQFNDYLAKMVLVKNLLESTAKYYDCDKECKSYLLNDLYNYAQEYHSLLSELMINIEVEFYVGDDE